jgi:DNA-binding beta-propeller fold protein YncE
MKRILLLVLASTALACGDAPAPAGSVVATAGAEPSTGSSVLGSATGFAASTPDGSLEAPVTLTVAAEDPAPEGGGEPTPEYPSSHHSDQNRDGVVDLLDVMVFAEVQLGQDWRRIDWCRWLQGDDKHLKKKQLQELLIFIADYYACDPLMVVKANRYPTRIAWAPDGSLYVSDALAGSVFVYERLPDLTLVAEYKKLAKPLGVALDASGLLYVGVDGGDRVEVYDPDGHLVGVIGSGEVRMPNDLAFDAPGNLYVADSRGNRVQVFDPAGGLLRSIGVGELRFPVALAISGGELFVADQASYQIKVFDLQGNLLRTLGGPVTQGSLGYKWKGKFVRLQAVGVDTSGRLHALDSQQGLIEILDATTGAFITSYGAKGTGPGEIELPLGMALNAAGESAISDAENRRVEILGIP